jgi:hypothetical protein
MWQPILVEYRKSQSGETERGELADPKRPGSVQGLFGGLQDYFVSIEIKRVSFVGVLAMPQTISKYLGTHGAGQTG